MITTPPSAAFIVLSIVGILMLSLAAVVALGFYPFPMPAAAPVG